MYNFNNETHEYILFMDIEFDQLNLVQFCGVLLRRLDSSNYVIYRSLNAYVQCKVSKYFMRYTGIENDFLERYGVTISDVRSQIQDELLAGVDGNKLLVVSHGVNGDLHILEENGIDIKHSATFCTFEKAKKILKRKDTLTLEDLCFECGVYPVQEHNAYIDTWLTLACFDYLKNME